MMTAKEAYALTQIRREENLKLRIEAEKKFVNETLPSKIESYANMGFAYLEWPETFLTETIKLIESFGYNVVNRNNSVLINWGIPEK